MAKSPQSQRPEPEGPATSSTSDLAERIARAKKGSGAAQAAQSFRQRELTGMGRAFRFASEFVAAIIVGALLGYGIDALLGTKPWAMIVLLLLGFAAGVLNVMRAAADVNAEAAGGTDAGIVPEDDD